MVQSITTAVIALVSGGVVPLVIAIMTRRAKQEEQEQAQRAQVTAPYDALAKRVAELESQARESSQRISLLEREQRIDRAYICDLVETVSDANLTVPNPQPAWLTQGGCS